MKLTVVSAAGLATLQDGGRPGRMHEGVPPGGAMAPELLAAANLALGNPPGAPAVEHHGRLVLTCDAPMVAATSDELVELGPSPRALEPRRRTGYLAVPGGFDAPLVLGGRGALLAAGVGRPMRAGDALVVLGGDAAARPPVPPVPTDAPIAVVLGPDPGDTQALLGSDFVVSSIGDRVGVRLEGPPVLAPPLASSSPMVRGAIQATPSGALVVLGPDHPTTGGYPAIAVVAAEDLGRLLVSRPGARIRFRQRGGA